MEWLFAQRRAHDQRGPAHDRLRDVNGTHVSAGVVSSARPAINGRGVFIDRCCPHFGSVRNLLRVGKSGLLCGVGLSPDGKYELIAKADFLQMNALSRALGTRMKTFMRGCVVRSGVMLNARAAEKHQRKNFISRLRGPPYTLLAVEFGGHCCRACQQ